MQSFHPQPNHVPGADTLYKASAITKCFNHLFNSTSLHLSLFAGPQHSLTSACGQASDAGMSGTSEMSDVAEDPDMGDDAYSAVSSGA